MIYPIDYDTITPDIEFYSEVKEMHQEAITYLTSFIWCRRILSAELYLNLGAVLSVFLFKIDNSQSKEDNYLWIVVGDIPPMYLDTYGPRSTKEVLEDYVHLADDWIEHIYNRESIGACYPFNFAPTIEMASLLKQKITFIEQTVLKNIDDIAIVN